MTISGKKLYKELLGSPKPVFFDGAMGTLIQETVPSEYSCPEELNLIDPGLLRGIHTRYIEAGSRIITTNTFGANRLKLARSGLENRLSEIIKAGVEAARSASEVRALVAGSIGPLGEFLKPVGSLDPEEAFNIFHEVALLLRDAGVDFIFIETMSDLKEVRAACLAAADSRLPFGVSLTYEDGSRTVLGTPPQAAVITVEKLGAALIGVNCSNGPPGLLPTVRELSTMARIPMVVQPNAGIPALENGQTIFPTGPEDFSAEMESFLDIGVKFLGGCCGTTPEHIHRMVRRLEGRKPAFIESLPGLRLASRTGYVLAGPSYPVAVIGERVNPSGRKKLAAELKKGEFNTLRREIMDQVQSGADLLDINISTPDIDEAATFARVLDLTQKLVNVPLVIDTTNPAALENALKVIEGRPLINSVNASPSSLEAVLPLAARYGAAVIGLAMDEKGVPEDSRSRLRLAERIVKAAAQHGLEPEDVLIDCLAMTAGSSQDQVLETLSALQSLRSALGTGSVLGVSNVSYGLPAREELNASFLSMAVFCGLDAAIINPYSERVMNALRASMVLSGRDVGATSYLKKMSQAGPEDSEKGAPSDPPRERAKKAIIQGDGESLVEIVSEALGTGVDPLTVNEEYLIPALEKVGELFEKKVCFLPQVMASAEAVRQAFDRIKEELPKTEEDRKDRLLLATVEGDIHDLGKNILKSLLENYGYLVEDMGINVPSQTIAARVKEGDIKLVGLSALMTTTLPAMEATIQKLKKECPGILVAVGGAVVTEDYARRIGADGYAPDAPQGVKLIRRLLSG
jgi:5-methyltetrahydrofolate--homocysteine methyltransferase